MLDRTTLNVGCIDRFISTKPNKPIIVVKQEELRAGPTYLQEHNNVIGE